jgi:hypothetical protein
MLTGMRVVTFVSRWLACGRLLAIPAMAALVLIVLTHCNNYITSRYFHTQQVPCPPPFFARSAPGREWDRPRSKSNTA